MNPEQEVLSIWDVIPSHGKTELREDIVHDKEMSHKDEISLFSAVTIATDYGPDDRMIGVRIPEGAGNFSLRHRVQTGSGAYPTSYPMGTGGSFHGSKAAGAWSWPLSSI
jgi:hypothetical protein